MVGVYWKHLPATVVHSIPSFFLSCNYVRSYATYPYMDSDIPVALGTTRDAPMVIDVDEWPEANDVVMEAPIAHVGGGDTLSSDVPSEPGLPAAYPGDKTAPLAGNARGNVGGGLVDPAQAQLVGQVAVTTANGQTQRQPEDKPTEAVVIPNTISAPFINTFGPGPHATGTSIAKGVRVGPPINRKPKWWQLPPQGSNENQQEGPAERRRCTQCKALLHGDNWQKQCVNCRDKGQQRRKDARKARREVQGDGGAGQGSEGGGAVGMAP